MFKESEKGRKMKRKMKDKEMIPIYGSLEAMVAKTGVHIEQFREWKHFHDSVIEKSLLGST
jgi:hypothetical protein